MMNNNFKNEMIYQWRMFRTAVKNGYEETMKILNYEHLKEMFITAIKNAEEKDKYEKQRKMYRKKEILQPYDLVEFYDPQCPGNVIKGRIVNMEYEYVLGRIEVEVEIIETGLRKKKDYMWISQEYILDNLIKIHQNN